MAIPWCVTLSGWRGWLLRCSNYFLCGDIGLFCQLRMWAYPGTTSYWKGSRALINWKCPPFFGCGLWKLFPIIVEWRKFREVHMHKSCNEFPCLIKKDRGPYRGLKERKPFFIYPFQSLKLGRFCHVVQIGWRSKMDLITIDKLKMTSRAFCNNHSMLPNRRAVTQHACLLAIRAPIPLSWNITLLMTHFRHAERMPLSKSG